jgi:hypothetical protein
MTKFETLCKQLEAKIVSSYEEGVTLEEAEKLAAQFLFAQLAVSTELKKADLDSRMRKNGVKSIRAAIYLDIVSKSDKKPTEAQITATIDTDKIVGDEQGAFDMAEVSKADLERYYDIFGNAHVYFRTISKGRFDG